MVCAVIDIGSNTVRMSVYEYGGGRIEPLINKKYMAGLISYVKDGRLTGRGMDKACGILESFYGILKNFKIENIYVFATASLRNVDNTKEAQEYIEKKTGFRIDVLSGEEEARLDFKGATCCIDYSDGLLVDIGGGSTELVVFKDRTIISMASMPIGSLNMFNEKVKKLFPTAEENTLIKNEVLMHLQDLDFISRGDCHNVCGVGGTVRAAFRLYDELYGKNASNSLSCDAVGKVIKKLYSDSKQRRNIILKTVPDRIHTVIPGMVILNTICRYFAGGTITKSSFGVREGYLLKRTGQTD